jgi:hypothetical protein
LVSGVEVWLQPPRFDSSLERIMGLILKNLLSGETGVQRFSKLGEDFFLLMKNVGAVVPPSA